ncbi:MAG: IS30 family transposase, partial [Bacteroidales bacterium]
MKNRPKCLSIESRAKSVLLREEFGHWEGDLVVSSQKGKGAILTLVERKTRFLISIKVPDRTQKSIALPIDSIERKFGDLFTLVFKSITFDNGVEFNDPDLLRLSCYPHKRNRLGKGGRFAKLYYAHPFCSGERGSNENANRMIRREFPKGTVFDIVSAVELQAHVEWINDYPRRILGG